VSTPLIADPGIKFPNQHFQSKIKFPLSYILKSKCEKLGF